MTEETINIKKEITTEIPSAELCEWETSKTSVELPLEAVQNVNYYNIVRTDVTFELNKQIQKLNVSDKIEILNKFKQLYANNQIITEEQLKEIFNKIVILGPITNAIMKAIGYEYRNTTVGLLIVENSLLRYERFHYLHKMIKMKNKNKPICYVGVRVIDDTFSFKKYMQVENNPLEAKKYFLLHAISRNGYINGLFTNILDRVIFTKWIKDILVTILAPDSVVMMDNGDLFNDTIVPITRYSSKHDMLQWLTANNIPFSDGMYKPQLYELIARSGIKDCEYKIDQILKSHGHDVLRTPPKFHDITPIELLWDNMRSEEYDIKFDDLFKVKQLIEKHIADIEPLKWRHFFDTVANWEKEIFEADTTIEEHLDRYVFHEQNIAEAI